MWIVRTYKYWYISPIDTLGPMIIPLNLVNIYVNIYYLAYELWSEKIEGIQTITY